MAFLTADHGAVTIPGREKARGLPVDYWNPEPMKARVDTAMAQRYGRTDLILTYDNDQFFLDRPLLLEAGLGGHATESPPAPAEAARVAARARDERAHRGRRESRIPLADTHPVGALPQARVRFVVAVFDGRASKQRSSRHPSA